MKRVSLYITLLVASLFVFQAQALKFDLKQEPLIEPAKVSQPVVEPLNLIGKDDPRNFYSRMGFGQFLEMAQDYDASVTLSNLYKYYIDNADYHNYIQILYADAKEVGREHISVDSYYKITDAQGVHRLDAQRVLQLSKDTFDEATFSRGEHTPVDPYSFYGAANLLFAESLSMTTFSYLVHGHQHSKGIVVDLETIKTALVTIFKHFEAVYPAPNCEELAYLFRNADTDKDGKHNLQEFHVFLTIYLRYYKYGLLNNKFAVTVMKDKVFEYVWQNEEGLGSRDERIKFLKRAFARFLQMNVYDKILNQMAHVFFSKFDTDGSGAIDPTEFRTLLSYFDAPENEIDILFTASDTDHSGEVDFSEFTVTLTTLLRKLDADFGYNLIRLTTGSATSENAYKIVQEATSFLGLDNIPEEKFDEIFESVDVDHNLSLDTNEFAQFVSVVITFLRQKVTLQTEAEISAMAGLDINAATPQDVIAIKQDASEQVQDITYAIDQGMGIEENWDDQLIKDETLTVIEQVEQETGVSLEELKNAVENQLSGASIEDVVQAVQNAAAENVINAVTADLTISGDECVTEEAVVAVIEDAIASGAVDSIIEETTNQTTEEIIEEVGNALADQTLADAIEQTNGITADELIEAVVEATGEELTLDQVAGIIEIVTASETSEEAAQAIESMSTEELVESVAEHVDEALIDTGLQETVSISLGDLVDVVAQETGTELTQDDVIQVIETVTGTETPEETIEALENLSTEELVDAVTEEVVTTEINTSLEESSGLSVHDIALAIQEETGEALTEEEVAQVIESITEAATTEDAAEAIQQLTPEEIIEAAVENVQQDVGPSETDIKSEVIDEIGSSVEQVIEEAAQAATQEAIDTFTAAVLDQVEREGCTSGEQIAQIIGETLESGVVDQIVEDVTSISGQEVIQAVSTAEDGGDLFISHEGESYGSDEGQTEGIIEAIEDETGVSVDQVEAIIESEVGDVSVDEVVTAAQGLATEQVIEAVAEAVFQEVQARGCTTDEEVVTAIEEVMNGGIVDEVIQNIEGLSPEEVMEAVAQALGAQEQQRRYDNEFSSLTDFKDEKFLSKDRFTYM